MDLFFVISGFLITSILIRLRDGGGSSWVFWGRRGLRILPLAMLYLLVLFVLTWLGDPLKLLPHFEGWAWYAFYLGNIHIAIYGWQPLAVMILWSLAIEEQFYLVWPLLVRACGRHRLLWWSGGLMVVAPVTRAITLSAADTQQHIPLRSVGLTRSPLARLWRLYSAITIGMPKPSVYAKDSHPSRRS